MGGFGSKLRTRTPDDQKMIRNLYRQKSISVGATVYTPTATGKCAYYVQNFYRQQKI